MNRAAMACTSVGIQLLWNGPKAVQDFPGNHTTSRVTLETTSPSGNRCKGNSYYINNILLSKHPHYI